MVDEYVCDVGEFRMFGVYLYDRFGHALIKVPAYLS